MLNLLSAVLSNRIRVFLQANIPLKRQHISIIDINEMINILKQLVVDDIIPKEIMLGNRVTPALYGGYKKYKDDDTQEYKHFWDDIEALSSEVFGLYFSREVKLQKGIKIGVPIMAHKFVPVIITPLFEIFQAIGPEKVISSFDTDTDPFIWLQNEFKDINIFTHETDILVSQKLITRFSRGL